MGKIKERKIVISGSQQEMSMSVLEEKKKRHSQK